MGLGLGLGSDRRGRVRVRLEHEVVVSDEVQEVEQVLWEHHNLESSIPTAAPTVGLIQA